MEFTRKAISSPEGGLPSAAEEQGLADGRRLRFLLPRRALMGQTGAQLAPQPGASLEFHDYRDYTPGDDLRNLDWTVLARTDREVVRVHHAEIAPVIEIFRDRSLSMETPPAKTDAADYLSGLVAAAAPTCRVIERAHPQTPRAVRIVISDFLTPDDPDRALAPLAHAAAALILVRILSRDETSPALGGAFDCRDVETGEQRELVFDAATLAAYHAAFTAHTARWAAAARRLAATVVDLAAEAPFSAHLDALARAHLVEGLA